MRRLLVLACAIVLVDTMFYAAIAPLLPHYQDEFGLSKSGAGILAGSYAAGTLLGSLPAGWFAARAGVKPAVVLGLGLMAASSVAFAFAPSVAVLDVARFVQGIGGAASWAGTLAWMIGEVPPGRRGQIIGTALAAAVFGALLGPALGTAAVAASPELVFSGVGVAGLVLILLTLDTPAAAPAERSHPAALLHALRRRRALAGLWLTVLPAVSFGVLGVLAPLRMDRLGASETTIGVVFLVAAGISGLLSPVVGRISDRRGRLLPLRACLAGSVVCALLLPLPHTLVLFALVVLLADPVFGAAYAPAGSLLSEEADSAGLDQALAFALFNLAWGVGQVIGSGGGSAIAQASSDAVAYVLIALLAAVSLGGILAYGRRRAPGRLAVP